MSNFRREQCQLGVERSDAAISALAMFASDGPLALEIAETSAGVDEADDPDDAND